MTPPLLKRSVIVSLLALLAPVLSAAPVVRIDHAPAGDGVTHLSWDTEGGARAERNLLRAPITDARAVASPEGGFVLTSTRGELHLPFDPRVTSTCIIPAQWREDGTFSLPAIINAPDFGPMSVTQVDGPTLSGRFEGDRRGKLADVVLQAGGPFTLEFRPLLLPAPAGSKDPRYWSLARRGWLNAIQPTSRWGEQNRPFSAPPGMLGNNVISDPASCSLWFYADQAFLIPEPFPGVNLMPLVRRTIEYWIDTKMIKDANGVETGELICYWDYAHFLDANAGPLIAAWDYVEVTGDRDWLSRKIGRLEKIANFLLSRDIDGDGLIEATQSGNLNTLKQPNRSCAWWDAVNCGHKDGYTNALCYRAFRCLASLQTQLGRTAEAARYTAAADRLKAAYFPALYNEKSGLLGWWRSEDGTLHDYAAHDLRARHRLRPRPGRRGTKDSRSTLAEDGGSRIHAPRSRTPHESHPVPPRRLPPTRDWRTEATRWTRYLRHLHERRHFRGSQPPLHRRALSGRRHRAR